jgi:hypothetical protein
MPPGLPPWPGGPGSRCRKGTDVSASFDVMDSLRSRVPITLLIDLLDPRGPNSARILRQDTYEPASLTTTLCRSSSSSAR